MHTICSIMGSTVSIVGTPIVMQIKYIFNVRANIRNLRKDAGRLEITKKEVEGKIKSATEAREDVEPTERVQKWLKEVQTAVGEVTKIEEKHDRLKMCFGGCLFNCWSGYKISKRAAEVTAEVKELLLEGKMDAVTKTTVPPVRPKSDSILPLATPEIFLRKAIDYMKDETVGMIGIWGMGGVGKTTLLKRINNHPEVESAGYDVVIWAVVSQEVNFDRIQKDIAKRIGLTFREQDTTTELQAEALRHYLKNKKFLLLLDDIWKEFDLEELGIPSPGSSDNKVPPHSKVVFTTRFEMVCDGMVAFPRKVSLKKIKVECLKGEEAWELFFANTGETVQKIIESDGRVCDRAHIVANKCAGLPLALVVIARAMSSNKTWREWEDAVNSINDLRLQELWVEGTDPLYPVLKVSYDRLMNDQMRKCFLCCSLWPEDFDIPKEDLIRCWLGMGLIADFRNIIDAFNKGHSIIERLKGAAMLEETEKDFIICVKLHDIIRGMALWIASDCEKWVVQAGVEINTITQEEEEGIIKWREAKIVSLMFCTVKNSSQFPNCPNATALMLRATEFFQFQSDQDVDGFIQNIPSLQYLDLSFHNWNSSMDRSRLAANLSSQLVGLQCLDLSLLVGLELPKELVNLSKLKYLFIRGGEIDSMPRGLISGLEKLEVLDLSNTGYNGWEEEGEARIEELGLEGSRNAAGGLKCIGILLPLRLLQQLSTNIHRHVPLWELQLELEEILDTVGLSKALFPGGIFPWTLKSLKVSGTSPCAIDKITISGEENDRLDNLEVLEFQDLWGLRMINWEGGATPQVLFQNLSSLTFSFCSHLKDVAWIAQLPYLEILIIQSCSRLEQVIGVGGKEAAQEHEDEIAEEKEEEKDNVRAKILPKLRFLELNRLRKLRSFCDPQITFPFLQRVKIRDCPLLNLSFLKKN